MQQPGRKSAAALSVVARAIDGRPKAPDDLTVGQKEAWTRTVANEAVEVFRTAATQQLLKEYCRHIETAERLTKQIDIATAEGAEVELPALDRLLKMRDRETKAVASLATKLRLTNQSRYQPSTAAAKKAGQDIKPWQMAG